MKKTDSPVVVETLVDAEPNEVWAAITKLEQMRQWFFENIVDFKAKPGFKTRFEVENERRVFPHLWEIKEVIPQRKMTYRWQYEGYAGDSVVTFELFEEGGRTRILLTHKVLEDFQEGIPEFTRESCLGGWNYFIKESLKNYLENNQQAK